MQLAAVPVVAPGAKELVRQRLRGEQLAVFVVKVQDLVMRTEWPQAGLFSLDTYGR